MAFGDFFSRLFGGGNNQYDQLFAARNAEAEAANARAVAAAKQAEDLLRASMVDPLDSEDARRKAEAKQRRLLAGAQPELGNLGAAPVGYKMLMGA